MDYFDLTETGQQNKRRARKPKGAVIHTPGRTFVNRVCQRAEAAGSPLRTAREIDRACALAFDRNKYQGGVFIGQSGDAYLLQQHDRRTWHSASLSSKHPLGNVYALPFAEWGQWALPLQDRKWQKHGRDPERVYDFWREAFDPVGIDTPFQLPFRRYPNAYVGIDLRPDTAGGYSEAQIETLCAVVREIADLGGFPIDVTRVLTHSLADPLSRGSVLKNGKVLGIAWDPGKWDHAAFLGRFDESC